MEKSSKDLEGVLKDCQCHFNWSLEEYEEFYSDPKLRVVEYIERYNSQEPHIFRNKFRTSLYLAYIMYRDGFDGWDKLLENGFRIMESTRDPDYPQGLNLLPSHGSPLYTGSSKDFFAYVENQTSNVVSNQELDSDDESEDGETYEGVEEHSLDGLYVAVEHIFYSLKASILFRIGSSPSEVHEVLSHAVHMNDMTQRDRAALLFMKANTIRNCGVKGLDVAVDILKLCVLTDPDDLKYPLFLINYLGEIRRCNWGCSVNKSEIQPLIEVIDSVLQHDLEPWMKVKYQFNKLQAINQMIYSNRKEFSPQEHSLLHQTCCELCKMITENTKKSRVISYCAQFYSKDKNNLPEALRLIEKASEKKPDDTYINAKACNIFRKYGRLDKALECAEKVAARGFGSCWQLLDLKLALKHDFDYEEFFRSILQNYPQDYQVRRTHKNAAFFYVILGDIKRSLEHFTDFLLDSSDYDDNDFVEYYCTFNRKTIHPVEAAYNIALYVLNSEYELDDGRDRSRMLDLGNAVKTKIEDNFDLDNFKYTGRATPKQYVDWLKQIRIDGERDSGPGRNTTQFRRFSHNLKGRTGGEANNYQDRRSEDYKNRYPVSRKQYYNEDRFRDSHSAGDQRKSKFGSGDELKSEETACRASSSLQRHASSARNMANYFGKLESCTEGTPADSAKTRKSQSDEKYLDDDQRKPKIGRFGSELGLNAGSSGQERGRVDF